MASSSAQTSQSNPLKRVLGIRDFFLLWAGQTTSWLGDQFHIIALSWLVLRMTGSPLALGGVLAVAGLPRIVFTLLGGAITDRISPRRVMLVSDLVRFGISALLAVQLATGTLELWMIYVYGLLAGVVSGAFAPASMSIVPNLVPEADLQAGNSVVEGSSQLIGFLGPAAAGAMIAALPVERVGMTIAFAFDAFTFVVSVVTLWMMHSGGRASAPGAGDGAPSGMLQSIRDGLAFLFHDPGLRAMFLLIAVANLAFGGPVLIGIPYLASTRYAEGAAAYGLIMSGYAGGNLLGIILCGTLPRLPRSALRFLLVGMFAAFGVGVAALAWIRSTPLAFTDMFILGTLNGYLAILLVTGLQRNTPRQMLGRLMSMVVLSNLVFMPLSQVAAGAIMRQSPAAVFLLSGGLLLACVPYLAVPAIGTRLANRFLVEPASAAVAADD